MKTGTDMSIKECRESGYPVIEHTGKFDPAKYYGLTISLPHLWPNGRALPGWPRGQLYMTDTDVSYNDLWELFESKGQDIKDFCDFKNCPYPLPADADFHDLASLAGTLSSYCGVE